MKIRKLKEVKRSSINLLLIGVALIIFGTLSLIFITQMQIIPGWLWGEGYTEYYTRINGDKVDDITGDGISEVLFYMDMGGYDEKNEQTIEHDTPKYGRVTLLDGSSGIELWNKEYNDPVKRVFQITDCDNDGYKDFFISRATVKPSWKETIRYDSDEKRNITDYNPEIIPDMFANFLISGKNGSIIPVSGIDSQNFTNYFVSDLVHHYDTINSKNKLISIEYKVVNASENRYNESIVGYDINGTKLSNRFIRETSYYETQIPYGIAAIEDFSYNGEEHLLYVAKDVIRLINLTANDNFSSNIYNRNINSLYNFDIKDFKVIEDLDSNGIPEIIIVNNTGGAIILNGSTGLKLPIPNTNIVTFNQDSNVIQISEITNADDDGLTYIVINIHNFDETIDQQTLTKTGVYSINSTTFTRLWEKSYSSEQAIKSYVLGKDFNGDDIKELLIYETYQSIVSGNRVDRYHIIDAITGHEYGQLNIRYRFRNGVAFDDFDSDGNPDFLGFTENGLSVISIEIPTALWRSPRFSFGFPLFIICIIFVILGVILSIFKGRELRFNIRKSVNENKLTFTVASISLILVIISFVLFLIEIDIFNFTLITSELFSMITISFVVVNILWFTFFPLTAAIYNQFAPQFSFFFIKLREIFFKVSKSHNHDIFVINMEGRTELGRVNKLKRLILPTLLSIAVGFYTYNYLAPILGFSTGFTVFGSSDFFSFLAGYTLLCTLPMILSFLIFSFLIAGNFLLDDAGIAYYRESKKYRIPGDIEPISIWAQSIIKGIAGISALLAFFSFFVTVDFSGFFAPSGDQGILFVIFGIFLVIVMFWGNPFITSFSYMLLAIDVMDLSHGKNVEKLYKIMNKKGYDIKPRTITRIYSSIDENKQKDELTKNTNQKID